MVKGIQHNKLMLLALFFKGNKLSFKSKNLIGLGLNLLLLITSVRSVQAVPETARRADDFVDSIGVTTHLYYDSSVYYQKYETLIKPKLLELGVRHVRDGAARNLNGYMDRVRELGKSGIRFTLVCELRGITPQAVVSLIKELGPEIIEGVTGTNEYNLSGDSNWVNNLRNYQNKLYQTVKGDSVTKNLTVYGPPLTESSAYKAVGDLSASIDYGTINHYYSGHHPGVWGWGSDNYGSTDWKVRTAKIASVSKPVIITETGYHGVVNTSEGHKGVPDDISGKYMPRLFLEHFNYGIPRTFMYELIDVYYNPNAVDRNLGLLRNDGSERPSYKAMKNLIGLLKDSRDKFTPGSLDYVLGGNTENIHHTLLQKQNGKFYLILWKEVSGFDVTTKQVIKVNSQKVNLTLNTWLAKATIYVPNNSSNWVSQQTYPKQLSIDVDDRPVVIELSK